MAESLIFRSQGFLFGLPSATVAGVSQQETLEGISFADYFFHSYEDEPHHIILAEGYVLHVHELLDIKVLIGEVPPVPGYVFDVSGDWLRGILWHETSPVLLLNEIFLNEDLAGYVPELSI